MGRKPGSRAVGHTGVQGYLASEPTTARGREIFRVIHEQPAAINQDSKARVHECHSWKRVAPAPLNDEFTFYHPEHDETPPTTPKPLPFAPSAAEMSDEGTNNKENIELQPPPLKRRSKRLKRQCEGVNLLLEAVRMIETKTILHSTGTQLNHPPHPHLQHLILSSLKFNSH